MTPLYSWSVEHDSNPRLEDDARSSESAVLTADLRFKRALENSEISIEPRYSLRRYSDATLGNGDDRSLAAGLARSGELTKFDMNASIWDQSTLITEALETGITRGDTHRLLAQASGDWTWAQSERWLLVAQASYLDVSYHGQDRAQLPGYRYPSGSIGERFVFSERGTVTFSFYGSALSSDTPGNSSRQAGLQFAASYAWSERTTMDLTVGESDRRLQGITSHGTDVSFAFGHQLTLGSISLNYTRSLVPYGIGFLVQRQQLTAALGRPLTPHLDSNLSLIRVQNSQLAVLLGVDRSRYDSAAFGLTWHPTETWAVGGQVSVLRAQSPQTADNVTGWRTDATVTWSPRAVTRSW